MDLRRVSGVNGEFRRRLSPRLHHNHADSHITPVDSSSVLRRFSPRLANKCPGLDITQQSALLSSKSLSHTEEQRLATPKAVPTHSNFLRRMSPRLQKDTSTQPQTRLSPRLHPYAPTIHRLDTSKEPTSPKQNQKNKTPARNPMQRRLSPRLHINQINQNQNTLPETPLADKRMLDASLASKQDHPQEVDFECSYINEITSASNGEPPHHLNMKAWANKAPDVAGRSDHAKVKETLRIFNSYYLQCAQEEEERRKQSEIASKKTEKASKTKGKEKIKGTSSRPDLKAISKMKFNKEVLYPKKKNGHLPGIDVGYQFYSRAEMVVIGFHSHWLNGIDYIGKSKGKKEHAKYTLPIAVAVVLSGQYEDNLDNADHVIYTGEGGNDLLGSKLQCKDQRLVRGNLAMKNNMDQSLPVRVIRGHKNADSYSGKIYSYDGLYKVVDYWLEKGCRKHLVYKFRLERIQGQPKLTTDQVQFVRGCPLKAVSELPGLVCRDISKGLEENCIPVTNVVDDPPVCPPEFTYIKSIEVAKSVKLPPSATGCKCKDNCTNPKTCACAKLNGQDFPYVRRDGGRLSEPKDVVFECGPNCRCKPECLNRTSQRKIKYRLEVYRTLNKGWAVRSWDYIPSGAPVCEYIGVLRRSDELDNIAGNDYIFEIDCLHTINEIEGRERRLGNVHVSLDMSLPKIDKKTLDGTPEFCIDAGSRGNVARFINHSCDPNLFVQCILSEHHDLRLARIVLIAADNISPMQELTYDYGYALDSVVGADGKTKVLPCFCGTDDCRKRLY